MKMETYDDFLKLLPTRKSWIIKRGETQYYNQYVVEDGVEIFYAYHPDVEDELRNVFPNCIFLRTPTPITNEDNLK